MSWFSFNWTAYFSSLFDAKPGSDTCFVHFAGVLEKQFYG